MNHDERRQNSGRLALACLLAVIIIWGLIVALKMTLIILGVILLILLGFAKGIMDIFFAWIDGESNAPNKTVRESPKAGNTRHPQNWDPLGEMYIPFRIKNPLPTIRLWWNNVVEYFDHPDLYSGAHNFWLDWLKMDTAPWPFGRKRQPGQIAPGTPHIEKKPNDAPSTRHFSGG